MDISQRSCSIIGVLLLFLLHGSCVDVDVHRAVGDSLNLKANFLKDDLEVKWKCNNTPFALYEKDEIKVIYDLFQKRLKTYKDNISITIEDLKLQDSGSFSIVATKNNAQLPTKTITLHVHDLIKDVKIVSWLPSRNCTYHFQCQAAGDPNPSYSWSGPQIKTGPYLNISLQPEANATLTCTANNTVSIKHTTETVVCSENPEETSKPSGFDQKYLLIAGGISIIAVVIFSATVAVCCKWRKQNGKKESEVGITVYEDVNPERTAKKRSESVINGISIYETVDDMNIKQKMPQTLYDEINYHRHPAVSANTSSSYQEVL